MKKIALIIGDSYLDVHKDRTVEYVSKKVYNVSDKDATRLLRQKTFKGKHQFGRVTNINPNVKPEEAAPEIYEGDVLGTLEEELEETGTDTLEI